MSNSGFFEKLINYSTCFLQKVLILLILFTPLFIWSQPDSSYRQSTTLGSTTSDKNRSQYKINSRREALYNFQ